VAEKKPAKKKPASGSSRSRSASTRGTRSSSGSKNDKVTRLPRRKGKRKSPLKAIIILSIITIALVAVWLVWFSSVLAVKAVKVTGVDEALQKQVIAAAPVPMGEPIAKVDTAAIGSAVQGALPWIASVDVRRGYPNDIVIAVTPRVALAQSTDGQAIDADGIAYLSPTPLPKQLLTIEGSDPDALGTAVRIYQQLPPEISRKIASLTAKSRDDVTFTLGSGAVVRWGNDQKADQKIAVLTALLPRRARMYDVSAPELPTTFDENPKKVQKPKPTPSASTDPAPAVNAPSPAVSDPFADEGSIN
jgi:cell division protein FtsQ